MNLTNELYKEICEQHGGLFWDIGKTFVRLNIDDILSARDFSIVLACKNFIPEKGDFRNYLMECYLNILRKEHNKRQRFSPLRFSKMTTKDDMTWVDMPLEFLNERERQIIELKRQGYWEKEIIQKLGWTISVKRVNQIYFSAIKKLQELEHDNLLCKE